jgi:hypothetical protein
MARGRDQQEPRGFAEAVPHYLATGWDGYVFALPRSSKNPPPPGVTGARGRLVTHDDISRWCGQYGDGNTALRMPQDLAGLDVDAHSGKPGAETLRDLERQLGRLPATAMSTARPVLAHNSFTSGTRIFRRPLGMRLPSKLAGIDIIRFEHRFQAVWPSMNPKTGTRYEWYSGPPWRRRDGQVPHRTGPAFAPLPDTWAEYLESQASPRTVSGYAAAEEDVAAFCTEHDDGTHPHLLAVVLAHAEARAFAGNGRHDTYLAATCWAIREAHAGFYSAVDALEVLQAAFEDAIGNDRDTTGEWQRIVAFAVGCALCDDPDEVRRDVLDRIEPGVGWAPSLAAHAAYRERLTDQPSRHEVRFR